MESKLGLDVLCILVCLVDILYLLILSVELYLNDFTYALEREQKQIST